MSACDSNIDRSTIARDAPLRLEVAAQLAFPDGSMTKSGLRREIARGKLECEIIAGKQFVTLSGIERMRKLCRVGPKVPASTLESDKGEQPAGSSSTDKTNSAQVAAQTIAEELKRPSPGTSAKSTSRIGETVIPLRS